MTGLPQTAQHWSAPENEARFTSEADGFSDLVVELYRRHSSRYSGARVGTGLDTWKQIKDSQIFGF